jgi:hypothetical protein
MAGRYGAFLDFATHHTLHAEAVGEHLRVRGEPFPAVRARGPYRGKRAALLKAFGTRERELAAQYQAALPGVRDPKVAALGAELYAAARAYAAVLRIEKP